MKLVDQVQLVNIVTEHTRKLERLETLGSIVIPDDTDPVFAHHTACVWDNKVAVHTIGRVRLKPGTGLRYVPTSWTMMSDVNGNVVLDILGGTGYPPVTSVCSFYKPTFNNQRVKTETNLATKWNVKQFPHDYYLIFNVQSFTTIVQLGFSLELAVELDD